VYLEDASEFCPCAVYTKPGSPKAKARAKTLADFFPVRARLAFDEEV